MSARAIAVKSERFHNVQLQYNNSRMFGAVAGGSPRTPVFTWVTAKATPRHRVRRFWKFKREDVDEWIRGGRQLIG